MDSRDIVIAVLVGYVVTDIALSMMQRKSKSLLEKLLSGDAMGSDHLIAIAIGIAGGVVAYYIMQNYKELETTIEKTF